ncbi:MAG: DNA polymerase III subunit alpha [Solobacterium sp.]|nr:DNA polymerase III subunit alpha [Solobacterium sp.]
MPVHLFVRSSYTFLNSTVRLREYIQYLKDNGFSHAVLTDRNVLYGAASFLRLCRQENMHPIIGLEADIMYHDVKVPFLLLSKDNRGYRNLMSLSSLYAEQGSLSTEDLVRCSGHCFLIVYGEGGWFDRELVSDDMEAVRLKLIEMQKELPVFDIALSYQEASLWKIRNASLKRVASSLSIRTVALNKVYYLKKEDAPLYRTLRAIGERKKTDDSTLITDDGRYLLSPEEMKELYDYDDLIRTDEIADACKATYELPKTGLPAFVIKDGKMTSEEYLPRLCRAGLSRRLGGEVPPVYKERLSYELRVIHDMHFEDYFLIVYDFILYAKRNGIYVGPGRGSAAGSLAAYCLGITEIDPLRYDLLFERFLNPERISMPDIDTDFEDTGRDDVIAYVRDKYGKDHVANIITFATLGARQVIRDTAGTMHISSYDTDNLIRQIPEVPGITLSRALKENARLKRMVDANRDLKVLMDTAMKLEGLPRHASEHAAGVVISDKPLSEVIPTASLGGDILTTQFPAEFLEERGLIKMDFLSVRNLTIIHEIVDAVQKEYPSFDINRIPLNDPATLRIFQNAETEGIFQFESAGIRNLLRRIRPVRFEDIGLTRAIFNPSSSGNIQTYLDNRKNPSAIRYPVKELIPVLKETYGVMVYQEQAMRTAETVAGFSLGRADVLRKAISKKNAKEMEHLRDEFLNGAVSRGHSRETAEELFSYIEKFSGYGFNKSHAVAYGLVSYDMAYLKANYPLCFYVSLLSSVIGNPAKTGEYIRELRRRKITLLYPDINQSGMVYEAKDNSISLPLSVVRGVSGREAAALIEEREENGLYTDFFDFTARALLKGISEKTMTALIDAGALDGFSENRRTLKEGLADAVRYGEIVQIREGGQMSIDLGLVSKPVLVRMKEADSERARLEKEALGFNIGEQPVEKLKKELGEESDSIAVILSGKPVFRCIAVIDNVRRHRTRKGDIMAFLKVSDETGTADVIVWPSLFQKLETELAKDTFIRFNGKISDDRTLIADRMEIIRKRNNYDKDTDRG